MKTCELLRPAMQEKSVPMIADPRHMQVNETNVPPRSTTTLGDLAMKPGELLRQAMQQEIVPMIGVYDVFSATLAGREFDGLFLSGFGFAASYYGLPDVGFIAWSDMVSYAERVRTVLPRHHLLVDIDDGYGDPEVAAQVVRRLDRIGVSGVILEDQLRPRRCGHYDGKQIMALDQYLVKLNRVLECRGGLLVVARTDVQDVEEAGRRVSAFAEAGCDAVMVEAVRDLDVYCTLRRNVAAPFVCNQIAGGKTPSWSLTDMSRAGVRLVIYSTPCLFAAQGAVEAAMRRLRDDDGRLADADPPPSVLGTRRAPRDVKLAECTPVLRENLANSYTR